MQNKKLQKLINALIIYAAMALLVFVLNYLAPGDMCNGGLGFWFLFLLAPLILIVLLIANFLKLASGNKDYLYSFFLYLITLLGGFIAFKLMG